MAIYLILSHSPSQPPSLSNQPPPPPVMVVLSVVRFGLLRCSLHVIIIIITIIVIVVVVYGFGLSVYYYFGIILCCMWHVETPGPIVQ